MVNRGGVNHEEFQHFHNVLGPWVTSYLLSVSSHDASEHIAESEGNAEGCERIVRHERHELVIGLFYLTDHTDGGMPIGSAVWWFGFTRFFDHRSIDQQRAGQDEWALVARWVRVSGKPFAMAEFAWWGDGPGKLAGRSEWVIC